MSQEQVQFQYMYFVVKRLYCYMLPHVFQSHFVFIIVLNSNTLFLYGIAISASLLSISRVQNGCTHYVHGFTLSFLQFHCLILLAVFSTSTSITFDSILYHFCSFLNLDLKFTIDFRLAGLFEFTFNLGFQVDP